MYVRRSSLVRFISVGLAVNPDVENHEVTRNIRIVKRFALYNTLRLAQHSLQNAAIPWAG